MFKIERTTGMSKKRNRNQLHIIKAKLVARNKEKTGIGSCNGFPVQFKSEKRFGDILIRKMGGVL